MFISEKAIIQVLSQYHSLICQWSANCRHYWISENGFRDLMLIIMNFGNPDQKIAINSLIFKVEG